MFTLTIARKSSSLQNKGFVSKHSEWGVEEGRVIKKRAESDMARAQGCTQLTKGQLQK